MTTFDPKIGEDGHGEVSLPEIASAPLGASTASLTYPFYSHGGVVGATKAGAAVSAWALTREAYSLKSAGLMSTEAAAAYQLHRDVSLAKAVRGALSSTVGSDVSVADLERHFRFKWRQVDLPAPGQMTRRLDPYFAQQIDSGIQLSFRDFLWGLPARLAALPGLNPSQRVEALTPQLNHACNHFYNRLSPMISGAVPNATNVRLIAETKAVCAELTAHHAGPMRKFVAEQIRAVRVLQTICAAVIADQPITQTLFNQDDLLQLLASQPPHQLLEELAREKIPFTELAEFLRSDKRSGVRGAASLPPNGAVREVGVHSWAKQYGEVVLACLVPVYTALNTLSTCHDAAPQWHGVIVAQRAAMVTAVARQTGGPSAAVPCVALQHTHATDDIMLVATSVSDPVAMLVPRMARVILQLVQDGHIGVRKVRTDLLIPLVRRWESEAIVELDALRQRGIEIPDVPPQDACTNTDDSSSDEEVEQMEVSLPEAPVAQPNQFSPSIPAGNVPLSLERDHAIIVCARDLLLERGGTTATATGIFVLFVKSVVSRVMTRAYESLKASERSTSQSVGCVFTKVATHLEASNRCVEYWKTDQQWDHNDHMSKPKSAGLVLRDRGIALTIEHLNHLISEMRNNGSAFAKTWFPSRSARSHSRRSLWQRRNGTPPSGAPGPSRVHEE